MANYPFSTGGCIAPIVKRYRFSDWAREFTCGKPEQCPEFFNETRKDHHYGCECGDCEDDYWMLKQ